MKRPICVLIFLLVFVLMITGCSGGNSGSTTTVVTGGSSQSQSGSSSSSGSGQSSGASSSPGMSIKPDQLISSSDAATLIGEAVKDKVTDDYSMLGLNICYYAAASASSKNWLQVAVLQQASGSSGQSSSGESSQPSSSGSSSSSQSSASAGQSESLTPKNVYEGLKKLFSDPNAKTPGRLGDDAFISAQSISILSGEYYIYIAVGSFSPEKAQTILKQASELALTNLNRILGK